MASCSEKRVQAFLFTAAVPRGSAVKHGADGKHAVIASAATDKIIGVVQDAVEVASSGEYGANEVAIQGGGGIGLAGGTIAIGDYVTSDANGALVTTTTANDRVVGQAMDSAVAGDIFPIEVMSFNY